MYDIELVKEILRQILWSAQTIAKRFAPITSPEDFVASESGASCCSVIHKSNGSWSWG